VRLRSPVRLILVILAAVLATGGLAFKLATIQFVEPDRYREWGASQRIRGHEIAANRGGIVDRNGVPLAVSHPQTTLWADPRLIDDPRAVAAALGSVLDIDTAAIEQRLAGGGAFTYIARQQPDEVADAALALELPGVFSYAEHARFNPSGENLARGVIGRAGLDQEGISGIEKQYRDVLIGEPGWVDVERGNDGSTIPGGVYDYVAPEPGSTLTLSLDRSLQYEAERQLTQQVRETNAKGGVVLVGDPETGEILAMANATRTEEDVVVPASANLAATWVFEPGSVFKPVTISGLVDVGAVTPTQWFDLPRSIVLYDKQFVDEHREGDQLQLKHILANSSNVGTITAAQVGANLCGRVW
jgi:cell division protein FtsI/penicillin-binding protein 2